MKLIFLSVPVMLVVLSIELDTSEAACKGGNYPYYFGTTDLSCVLKGRRKRHPKRYIHSWTHRWIYYRGKYYEFVRRGTSSGYRPRDSYRCNWRFENKPAGYSNLSPECLERCTRNYERNFGSYDFLSNNCHVFANQMSDALCHYNYWCPSWCNWREEKKSEPFYPPNFIYSYGG